MGDDGADHCVAILLLVAVHPRGASERRTIGIGIRRQCVDSFALRGLLEPVELLEPVLDLVPTRKNLGPNFSRYARSLADLTFVRHVGFALRLA